jgi:UPF0716 protein FxsA
VRVLLLLVLVMVAEVYVFVQAVDHLGVLTALALLVLISASGPWLVRRTGLGVWRRAQSRLEDGEVPGRELVDGVLLFAAGVLLTLPGFITGVAGALLLLPPVRAVARVVGARWLARRVVVQQWGREGADGQIITAGSRPVDRRPGGAGDGRAALGPSTPADEPDRPDPAAGR